MIAWRSNFCSGSASIPKLLCALFCVGEAFICGGGGIGWSSLRSLIEFRRSSFNVSVVTGPGADGIGNVDMGASA